MPDNLRKIVEEFMQIVSLDHPLASKLMALIEQFEKRLEAHDLANDSAAFYKI
tara:strand:+ start:105 stop:263 length:159 start_codon:yes stop_codon:yes gene_type:complete